jgi:hypothetical protein
LRCSAAVEPLAQMIASGTAAAASQSSTRWTIGLSATGRSGRTRRVSNDEPLQL